MPPLPPLPSQIIALSSAVEHCPDHTLSCVTFSYAKNTPHSSASTTWRTRRKRNRPEAPLDGPAIPPSVTDVFASSAHTERSARSIHGVPKHTSRTVHARPYTRRISTPRMRPSIFLPPKNLTAYSTHRAPHRGTPNQLQHPHADPSSSAGWLPEPPHLQPPTQLQVVHYCLGAVEVLSVCAWPQHCFLLPVCTTPATSVRFEEPRMRAACRPGAMDGSFVFARVGLRRRSALLTQCTPERGAAACGGVECP